MKKYKSADYLKYYEIIDKFKIDKHFKFLYSVESKMKDLEMIHTFAMENEAHLKSNKRARNNNLQSVYGYDTKEMFRDIICTIVECKDDTNCVKGSSILVKFSDCKNCIFQYDNSEDCLVMELMEYYVDIILNCDNYNDADAKFRKLPSDEKWDVEFQSYRKTLDLFYFVIEQKVHWDEYLKYVKYIKTPSNNEFNPYMTECC